MKHKNLVPRPLLRGILLGGAILITGLFAIAQTTTPVDVLATAHSLGEEYKSNRYVYPATNLPAGTKTVDCTGFTLAVVKKLIPDLSTNTKTRIVMSDLTAAQVQTNAGGILTNGDDRAKGVQQALVDLDKGTVVSFTNVAAGDIVQYWIQTNNFWFGHSGVVEQVVPGPPKRIKLYGSHKSANGIGIAPSVGLELYNNSNRQIHIVRYKP